MDADGHRCPHATSDVGIANRKSLLVAVIFLLLSLNFRRSPGPRAFTVTMTISSSTTNENQHPHSSAHTYASVCPSWVQSQCPSRAHRQSWSGEKPRLSPWCAPAAGSHVGATAVRAASGTRRWVAASAAAACVWEPPAPAAAAAPGGLQAFTTRRSQVAGVFQLENTPALLTDDRAPARLRRCGTSCGGWWRGMGLGNQAEGGLLLVVVVVVYTQVHGEDGCSCGGHLHGQCCCAHVHWKMRQTSQAKDYHPILLKEKKKKIATCDQRCSPFLPALLYLEYLFL